MTGTKEMFVFGLYYWGKSKKIEIIWDNAEGYEKAEALTRRELDMIVFIHKEMEQNWFPGREKRPPTNTALNDLASRLAEIVRDTKW